MIYEKNENLVLSFVLENNIFELFRIKTIRRNLIFIDNSNNFYSSWNEFWHVFNHLDDSENFHWSKFKHIFIHNDFTRFIIKELNKFRKSISIENWDEYLSCWSEWDKLSNPEISLEIDISDLKFSNSLNYIGLKYNEFKTFQELLDYIYKNYLKNNIPESSYNLSWFLTNLYTGHKVTKEDNTDLIPLSDVGIFSGDIIKVVIK